jgi:D-galactarolactone isomerase
MGLSREDLMSALCQPARATVKAPKIKAPAKSVDCHFHIFGPEARYPYAAKRGYTPPEALIPQYNALIDTLGIERMVVVHPSVYGTDNRCSLDAVKGLGRERCRMIAVVDEQVSDGDLKQMDEIGVRGVRFNLVNVGALRVTYLTL